LRLRLVAGVLCSAAISLLPSGASASGQASQKLIAISDSHMMWTTCGKNCMQGIDSIDSISATIRGNTLVLGEVLGLADSKAIFEEKSVVLSNAADYGGQSALSWVAREMKVWEKSAAPFQASVKFNGDQFTFGGWAGDGSLALMVVFG
jgi:hypothetical protein